MNYLRQKKYGKPPSLIRNVLYFLFTVLFLGSFSNSAYAQQSCVVPAGVADSFPAWTTDGKLRQSSTYEVSGNVGVGTAAPQAKLDVNGSLKAASVSINGAGAVSLGSSTWTPFNISGIKGGYSGFNFTDVGARLMVAPTVQGIHKDTGWQWYFSNGTLTAGSVPIARIPDIANASVNYAVSAGSASNATNATNATNGRYVYDNGSQGGSVGYKEASLVVNNSSKYSTYGRMVYDNGTYSGAAGYREASDMHVRKAQNAVWSDGATLANNATNANQSNGAAFLVNPSSPTMPGIILQSNGANNGADYYIKTVGNGGSTDVYYDIENYGGTTVWRKGSASGYVTTMWLTSAGALTIANVLTQNSDIRLKKDVTPLTNSLDKVRKLNGVSFLWKDPEKNAEGKKSVGFIAQEVEKIIPEVIDKGTDGFKGIQYQNMISYVVEAIKELAGKFDELNVVQVEQAKKITNTETEYTKLTETVKQQAELIEKQQTQINSLSEKIDKLSNR